MKILLLLVTALAAAPLAAAQLYRWVDEQGRVEWRDTPPPPHAKSVEQRNMGGNSIQTSTLPYSVQQAVKNFPVTLWVFDCGEPCADARNHLARRGVPHTVRDAQKEYDVLKKATGSGDVPVLIVGSRSIKGYLAQDWDAALDNAGYPRTPPPGMKVQPQSSAPGSPSPKSAAPQSDAPKSAAPQAAAETGKPAARQP